MRFAVGNTNNKIGYAMAHDIGHAVIQLWTKFSLNPTLRNVATHDTTHDMMMEIMSGSTKLK
jgi:hypothetical protein